MFTFLETTVGVITSSAGLIFLLFCCAYMLCPEAIDKAMDKMEKSAKLSEEQSSMYAYTEKRCIVEPYKSQEEARRHRVTLKVGTIIYFPNGTNITVEEGLKDVESEGWWYAWMSK